MGLWINQECKRHWEKIGEHISFDELDEAALNAQPFKAIIDVDDSVFFEPGNMPTKVQEFCARTNQEVPQTKGEIVRCVMESLALKYRYVIEGLEGLSVRNFPNSIL